MNMKQNIERKLELDRRSLISFSFTDGDLSVLRRDRCNAKKKKNTSGLEKQFEG